MEDRARAKWADKWGQVVPISVGELGPHLTQRPSPMPTSVPSAILIHPDVWPQYTWAENWGICPLFGEELGAHLTQCGQAEAYLHAMFHLDPSNRLARVHQKRYRQTDRTDMTDKTGQTDKQTDRQRSDSIGRTALQTVAQKS